MGRSLRTHPRGASLALSRTRSARRKVLSSIRRHGGVRPKLRLRRRVKLATKSKSQRATPTPNRSGSESAYKISLRNKGLLKKFANKVRPLTLTFNGGNLDSQLAGKQCVSLLGGIFDRVDLHNMVNTATTQEFGTSIPAGYKNLQIYLKEGHATYAIVNPGNAVQRVILYDIMPRRDTYQTIGGQALLPDIAWSEGMVQQQSNSTTSLHTDMGCRPWDSQLFNDYFKVKCTTYIDLAPGQCHWHRVNFKPHKFLDRDIIDANSSSSTAFKGLTLYCLAVTQGQPIHDSASSITTTPTKLEWVQSISYHFSYISNNMTTTYVQATLSTSPNLVFESLVTGASAAFALV